MPKKTLVRIEEGATVASAATGCAELLDAGIEQQLGPAGPGEDGLGITGRLAVRVARRLVYLRQNLETTTEILDRIQDDLCDLGCCRLLPKIGRPLDSGPSGDRQEASAATGKGRGKSSAPFAPAPEA